MNHDHDIDCEAALVVLYQFLDGHLTMERRQSIELHLDGCPNCFSAFDFEQELRLVVRSKLQMQVPPALRDRIGELLRSDDGGNPGVVSPFSPRPMPGFPPSGGTFFAR